MTHERATLAPVMAVQTPADVPTHEAGIQPSPLLARLWQNAETQLIAIRAAELRQQPRPIERSVRVQFALD